MSDPGPGIPVERIAAQDGNSPRVGRFSFYFTDERWEWSPEVAAMHGYPAAIMTTTTEVVLSHKHPDDYEHVAATLDAVRHGRQTFSSRHRIIDTRSQVHHVVVIAEQLTDDTGVVIGSTGFYVDITAALQQQQREQRIDTALAAIVEHRESIEQAKGMLMLAYGVNADAAFDLLRWQSQQNNVKLRPLAEQIVADYLELAQSQPRPDRADYDRLLLTAHQRVGTASQGADRLLD
ncbi:PAS and ANTAR domain-containing protein [Mycolicibacterium brisbanense]|nr:PAS and ANTAR domain-containing protein [Mycolicibacterium brisbanense]MCV7158444.1 PAS and ANTAR domain-containing protein [Mycolicibacterium brisbanense]